MTAIRSRHDSRWWGFLLPDAFWIKNTSLNLWDRSLHKIRGVGNVLSFLFIPTKASTSFRRFPQNVWRSGRRSVQLQAENSTPAIRWPADDRRCTRSTILFCCTAQMCMCNWICAPQSYHTSYDIPPIEWKGLSALFLLISNYEFLKFESRNAKPETKSNDKIPMLQTKKPPPTRIQFCNASNSWIPLRSQR